MSKFDKRMKRLIERTHIFVPREKIRLIAESMKLRLEEIDKKPNLERRVKNLTELLAEFGRTKDPAVDAKLISIFETDEEARLTYFLSLWESEGKRTSLGTWQTIKTGTDILEIAKRSSDYLDWKKEEAAKQLEKKAKEIPS